MATLQPSRCRIDAIMFGLEWLRFDPTWLATRAPARPMADTPMPRR